MTKKTRTKTAVMTRTAPKNTASRGNEWSNDDTDNEYRGGGCADDGGGNLRRGRRRWWRELAAGLATMVAGTCGGAGDEINGTFFFLNH